MAWSCGNYSGFSGSGIYKTTDNITTYVFSFVASKKMHEINVL
jgi:hypothetical protein